MAYTTYENRWNPHVTIHRDGCGRIGQNGGGDSGGGAYHTHETLADAERYAQSTGLPVRHCSFCNP
jgi:hypothetical protein